MNKLVVVLALLALQVAPVLAPPIASANPSNCEQIRWGFLGSQTRTICDSPTRADGSWTRRRMISWPSYYVRGYCSGSGYYFSCSEGYWMPPGDNGIDEYVVFPDNVLPNEPGHLPVSAANV